MNAVIAREPALHFMVEAPAEGATVDDEVVIAGWCLSTSDAPAHIRVRAAEHLV